jgi:outer membrane protein OmpA-like peptidoglycan-associated protein
MPSCRNPQEENLSGDFDKRRNARNLLLTGALFAVVALSQWGLASGSVAAGSEPGTISVAQNPPPCGHDPQHPCPKGQQPQPKQPPQPQPKQTTPPPAPPTVRQQQPTQPHPVQNQPPQQQQQHPVQNQPPQNKEELKRTEPVQNQPPQNRPPELKRNEPVQNQPPPNELRRNEPVQNQPPQGQQPRFGNIQQMQQGRQQHVDRTGRTIIEEPDHRQIVREAGHPVFIHHDENERFLRFGQGHVERRGNEVFNVVVEPNGFQLVTVTDPDGRLIRRFRRGPDGREIVLINNALPVGGAIYLNVPEPVITIPQDQYIVDTGVATEPLIYAALEAPPLVPIERAYSLDEILNNVALRDRMRRIDVDTITFDTGSWEVTPDQVGRLDLIADAIKRVLTRNPNEVFLIEGHTDAVGNDVDNLSLSDRRAETIADILSSSYQIPPENLTTQGYGAQFLKIPTPEPNRQNRRVTVRRITPLLVGANG